MSVPLYKSILIKLSGEALMGDQPFGIDPSVLDRIASEIKQLAQMKLQIGVVIGGGNLFRGAQLKERGMDQVTGDHMGMLATVMNGLALRDAMEQTDLSTRLMSAIPIGGIVEHYDRRKAIRYLRDGDVVIYSAGTGNPFFTTDTSACLRAIETNAEVMFKATQVDGVYDKDPNLYPDAQKFDSLSYDDILSKQLKVMDMTAASLARDNGLPIRVFNLHQQGSLMRAVTNMQEGTLITQ